MQELQQGVQFRFAGPEDTALILRFIRALARYEGMEAQVVADEAMLEKWLFQRKKAEVLFALSDGTEVGFALFFHNFSTFLGRAGLYLEDLFVLPAYRGRGFGKALLQSWRPSPWSGNAAGWNGGAWTGTGPASTFTRPWERSPWRNGPYTGSMGRP